MSETQLATNGFGSMFSWQEMKGKKSNAPGDERKEKQCTALLNGILLR